MCASKRFLPSSLASQLIDLLMRVILDPGDVIINTPPTFGMYSFDCAVNGEHQDYFHCHFLTTLQQ